MPTMKINGFSDLILEAPGCHPGVNAYRADFMLDTDFSPLLPYINAVAKKAQYYDHIPSIQFELSGHRCAIYPEKVSVGMFENRDQAVSFFNHVKEFINDIADRSLSITPNYKAYRPVPVFEIFKLLPKTNCKECGLSTCMAFAAALSKGEEHLDVCPELQNPKSNKRNEIEALFS